MVVLGQNPEIGLYIGPISPPEELLKSVRRVVFKLVTKYL